MCFLSVVSSHNSGRFGRFCTSPVFWSEERGHRHPAKGSQGWLPRAMDTLLLCDTPCQSPLAWAASACWDTPVWCEKLLRGTILQCKGEGVCSSSPTLSEPGSACVCAVGVAKCCLCIRTLWNAFHLSLHPPLLPYIGGCHSAGPFQPFVDNCHFLCCLLLSVWCCSVSPFPSPL